MPIEKSDNEKIFAHTDDCYEVIAGREEEYLEEGIETLRERELLVSEETANNLRRAEPSAAKEVDHAAEELIAGDPDDPPLSDEAVVEMRREVSKG